MSASALDDSISTEHGDSIPMDGGGRSPEHRRFKYEPRIHHQRFALPTALRTYALNAQHCPSSSS
eukprot:7944799-Heterocapsa_arctica.AAC.1